MRDRLIFFVRISVVIIFFSRTFSIYSGFWHPVGSLFWFTSPSPAMFTLPHGIDVGTEFKIELSENKKLINLLEISTVNFLYQNQTTSNLIYILYTMPVHTHLYQKAKRIFSRNICIYSERRDFTFKIIQNENIIFFEDFVCDS